MMEATLLYYDALRNMGYPQDEALIASEHLPTAENVTCTPAQFDAAQQLVLDSGDLDLITLKQGDEYNTTLVMCVAKTDREHHWQRECVCIRPDGSTGPRAA